VLDVVELWVRCIDVLEAACRDARSSLQPK
jgi:hypothetical protein